MTDLENMILDRISDLGQKASHLHHELEVWRPEPLTASARTTLSVDLNGAINEQQEWIKALKEVKIEEIT